MLRPFKVVRNSFLARAACANLKWNMLRARVHKARACANNDLVPTKSLENLDFDQKYL